MRARVALLGCGRIAHYFHLPILAALPGVEIAALADADPSLLESAAKKAPGAERHPDWKAALATEGLNAAIVCLPPALHAPAALEALSRSLHTYVEKPLALTLPHAEDVVAARPPQCIGATGFNFRMNDRYSELREELRSQRFGEISMMRFTFAAPRRTLPSWKALRATGGGALRDLAVHHLDLARFLLGEEISVLAAEERSVNSEGDVVSILARSTSGVTLLFAATQTTAHAANEVELLCEAGAVTVRATDGEIAAPRRIPGRFARPKRLWSHARELLPPRALRHENERSFHTALAAFGEAVRSDDPVQAWKGASFDSGLAVARLIARIEELQTR